MSLERSHWNKFSSPRDLSIHMQKASKLRDPKLKNIGTWINEHTGTAVVLGRHGGDDNGIRDTFHVLQATVVEIGGKNPDAVSDALGTAFDVAHNRMLREGGGSIVSATAVKIVDADSGRVAVFESIGKTRAYLLRNATLTPLTQEDGLRLVENVAQEGQLSIREQVVDSMDAVCSEEERAAFQRRHFGLLSGEYLWDRRHTVTRALGKRSRLGSQFLQVPVEAGDRLLLADQGVHALTRYEIKSTLQGAPLNTADALIQRAHIAMGSTERVRGESLDINAVVIDILPRATTFEPRVGRETARFRRQ